MEKGIKLFQLLFFFFFTMAVMMPARASEEELRKEIEFLKERVVYLENKVTELEQQKLTVECKDMIIEDFDKHLDSHLLHREEGYQLLGGLRMGIGATVIVQGTDNANGVGLSAGDEDVIVASYSVDLEFEKEFDSFGRVFLHLETGDGAGIEDELQVFSNVNRDADDSDNSVSVTEVWYEQDFESFPATIIFGKIDPTVYIDTNNYANCECTQFLGHIFRNSPALEFPDNAAGARLLYSPADTWNAEFIILDADSDWEDVFDDVFAACQLTVSPEIAARPGNWRVYGWFNDSGHTQWDNTTKTQKENYGFGVSLDQEVTDTLGVFARYGWQNPEVFTDDPDSPGIDTGTDFSIEHAWSVGVQVSGIVPDRDDDIFGIAFGQVIPSDEYKKAASVKADSEEHLEAYYSCKLNGHLTVTPDVQIIWDPFGNDAANGENTIVIGGIRAQIDL